MLENIDAIMQATKGKSADEFKSDYLVQRAVERAIEIISEAAKSLPAELRDSEPNVPWRDIIGIGNLLRHEYYRIESETMRDILHTHLPRLRPAVLRLLTAREAKS
jgi:uncharacterized protein with HEPN domain